MAETSGGRRRHSRLAELVWWLVVVGLAFTAARELHGQARVLRSDIEVGTGRTRLYRELQPARTVGLSDLRLFLAAERTIPRDDTFAVITGSRAAIKDPLVLRWVHRFARYRLLPRRLVLRPADADWILSYGGDPSRQGVHVQRVIRVGPGIELVEVAAP